MEILVTKACQIINNLWNSVWDHTRGSLYWVGWKKRPYWSDLFIQHRHTPIHRRLAELLPH